MLESIATLVGSVVRRAKIAYAKGRGGQPMIIMVSGGELAEGGQERLNAYLKERSYLDGKSVLLQVPASEATVTVTKL